MKHNVPDWSQHERPVACAIAQQYSPTTTVSLRFQCRDEKFDAHFKNVISIFQFVKIVYI